MHAPATQEQPIDRQKSLCNSFAMTTTKAARARGAMWGQAVGDALGTTVEFASESHIAGLGRSELPGWPEQLIGKGPFGLAPGQITDDTELALCLAGSLVRRGRYDEDDAARSYLWWRQSGPFDVGFATHQAFVAPIAPHEAAAKVMSARASKTTQANGSLMRSSPLGVFGAGTPRARLAEWARADSRLSHPSDVTQAACAVYVTTLADAIETGAEGPTLFERALAFARGSPVEDTLRAAREGLPASDGDHMGWVRLALQHAFFHLLHARQFAPALIATVRKGGDTDTNAAIVGALLGATLGVDAIPSPWRLAVASCECARPDELRTRGDRLDVLAAQLLEAGAPRD